MDTAEARADALIERAREIWLEETEGYERFESVLLDHVDTRAMLTFLAKKRDVTLDDLARLLEILKQQRDLEIKKERAFEAACEERSNDLHVFKVYNTADRIMTVIAKDADCAKHFAWQADHVHRPANGRATQLSALDEAELRRTGSALARALRDGYPGVVERLGQNVVMKRTKRVYTPFSIVGDD